MYKIIEKFEAVILDGTGTQPHENPLKMFLLYKEREREREKERKREREKERKRERE